MGTTTAPTTVMETGPIIQPMTPEPMTWGGEAMEIPNSEDPMQLTSIKVEPTTVTPQNEAVLGDLSAVEPMTIEPMTVEPMTVEPMTPVPVTETSDSTSLTASE